MSTVLEIEEAIEHLPVEELPRVEAVLRRRMQARVEDLAAFDEWLAGTTGIAKGKLTTAERMQETRGEE